jgi:hypothetical protein
LRIYSKLWTAAVAACLVTLVLAALVLHQSFRLTALSDVIQCLLLLSGTISLIPQAVRSRGRLRLFWMLITTGIAFWFCYQLFWTYYEVWLRTDVPDLCAADMVLFLHIVPLMAALALRPHAPQDEYSPTAAPPRLCLDDDLVDVSLRPHCDSLAVRRRQCNGLR